MLFEIQSRGNIDMESVQPAAALCARCPVIMQCYAWAAEDYSYEGVAAGWIWRGNPRRREPTGV